MPIEGAWLLQHEQFSDERGVFLEWFRGDAIVAKTGGRFPVAQANLSRSRRGTIRGIHFSVASPGQGKYVMCVEGQIRDVVVDVRVGSPTFGRWCDVLLDEADHRCLLIEPGLGHAFQALTDWATVTYLCSTVYDPPTEKAVDPLDSALAIGWAQPDEAVLSTKDRAAPTLAVAEATDGLPTYAPAT